MKNQLKSPLLVVAIAFYPYCTTAAPPSSGSNPSKKGRNRETSQISKPSSVEQKKTEQRINRARSLALKRANVEFLASPEGKAFQEQIDFTDDEINATYERYLNVFFEKGEKRKRLYAERDQQIQHLKEKRKKSNQIT